MGRFFLHDAKTNLSKLIAYALAGDDVVIARGNVPVVRLVPVAPRGKPVPGVVKGKISWDNASTTHCPGMSWMGGLA